MKKDNLNDPSEFSAIVSRIYHSLNKNLKKVLIFYIKHWLEIFETMPIFENSKVLLKFCIFRFHRHNIWEKFRVFLKFGFRWINLSSLSTFSVKKLLMDNNLTIDNIHSACAYMHFLLTTLTFSSRRNCEQLHELRKIHALQMIRIRIYCF